MDRSSALANRAKTQTETDTVARRSRCIGSPCCCISQFCPGPVDGRASVRQQKLQWYAWHKWIGITVFLVTCRAAGSRGASAPPPPLPARCRAWQRRALSPRSTALLYG